MSAAVSLDCRCWVLSADAGAVRQLERRRPVDSTERADAATGRIVDDARLLPVERAHRDVVVLLLGGQVVRAGRDLRFARSDRAEAAEVKRRAAPVE